ncbi:MAG TPA: hypothetical protein VJV21_05990 [Pyrinomonadaceae bacterium]|nr:hypothetical protein [Pyrinomonadaceae bacterium]
MKGIDARNSNDNLARVASLNALLLPLLLVLAALLSAPGVAIAQSTVDVCRETNKVLRPLLRELDEAERLSDVKSNEEEWRGVLAELRRGIASGYVISRLDEFSARVRVRGPGYGASNNERLAFQKTLKDFLEKAIQEARDSDEKELLDRLLKVRDQTNLRENRMDNLKCSEVFKREGEDNLSGTWICKAKCPAGGEGKAASIAHNGEALTFTNEGGQSSAGRFTGSKSVLATGWGNLTGTIANDGKELRWDNGTTWVRR